MADRCRARSESAGPVSSGVPSRSEAETGSSDRSGGRRTPARPRPAARLPLPVQGAWPEARLRRALRRSCSLRARARPVPPPPRGGLRMRAAPAAAGPRQAVPPARAGAVLAASPPSPPSPPPPQ